MDEIWYYSLHGELSPVPFSEEDIQQLLERTPLEVIGIYFFASLVSS